MKVPEGLNKNLTLPRDEYLSRVATKMASEEVTRFEECRMYVSPYNHSWGKKPCVYGYEFHVDGAEWTVVSEVGFSFLFVASVLHGTFHTKTNTQIQSFLLPLLQYVV